MKYVFPVLVLVNVKVSNDPEVEIGLPLLIWIINLRTKFLKNYRPWIKWVSVSLNNFFDINTM